MSVFRPTGSGEAISSNFKEAEEAFNLIISRVGRTLGESVRGRKSGSLYLAR